MNIFPDSHRFMVSIMDITGDIATGTIADSSTVTIYSNITMIPHTIYFSSTMATVIGLLDSSTVRYKMITITFLLFVAISTRGVAIIVCTFCRCCVSFRNRNVIEIRPKTILEKFSILILKIPTNPNLVVFGIGNFILHQTRVFEIKLGFHFIVIGIVIKNILIENIT